MKESFKFGPEYAKSVHFCDDYCVLFCGNACYFQPYVEGGVCMNVCSLVGHAHLRPNTSRRPERVEQSKVDKERE